MNIFLISCVFPPEPVVSANTSYHLANACQKNGNEVTVITNFPNKPGGSLYEGYKRSLFLVEKTSRGYKIVRCFSTLSEKSSLVSRFLENFTFGITSGLTLLFSDRPTVVYVNTWPIFAQGITCLIARLRRIPLVLNIQDIYPESLVSQGRTKSNSLFAKFIRWLDVFNTRSSQALIVISEKYKDIYIHDRGLPVDLVHVVPNWVDDVFESGQGDGNSFRERIGIANEELLFVFAGNIGAAAGVEQVIEVFKSMQKNEKIKFLIAGDGAHLHVCQRLIIENNLKNIFIHSPWLHSETVEVLSAADIFVLPTRADQSLVSVPSKLINYMFASRPILGIAHPQSELAEVIRQAGNGWVVEPDDLRSLVDKITEITRLTRSELLDLGIKGRKYALENYTREKNLPRIIDVLQTVAR